jgi:hypothetical protein
MHAVGSVPGLYLVVTPTAAAWILRYSHAGRRRDMGLGSRAEVGLAEAREQAATLRRKLRDGIDPLGEERVRLMNDGAARCAQPQTSGEAVAVRRSV